MDGVNDEPFISKVNQAKSDFIFIEILYIELGFSIEATFLSLNPNDVLSFGAVAKADMAVVDFVTINRFLDINNSNDVFIAILFGPNY